MLNQNHNDIAIIGMDCLFPGANGLMNFWDLLLEGRDAIKTIPNNRWAHLSDETRDTYSFKGGVVDEMGYFDFDFFGITEREAKRIDPQQRVILHTAWRAIEDAGINPGELRGTDTAVFIGVMGNEWIKELYSNPSKVDVHAGTGNGYSIIANRLSYYFDWHGASMAIDTACSSSLTALDLACQQLQLGKTSLALVGGVNAIISPVLNNFYQAAGLAASNGCCKSFGSDSDGIGRGEGAGVVVIKRLEDALKDSDSIYAVIKGSAINHDGLSNGMTAPNRWQQERVLEKAYKGARIQPSDVTYIEAHGTGTRLGDPIEANALMKIVGEKSTNNPICYMGSVKSNLGHLEGAAGIAGIIKAALSIYFRQIPPSLHFGKGNPYIDFKKSRLKVATQQVEWPMPEIRLAGVSAFGLGGSNAHVVLSNAPKFTEKVSEIDKPVLIKLSAKTHRSLECYKQDLRQYIDSSVNICLYNLANTMNISRCDFLYRHTIVANSLEDLSGKLNSEKTAAKPTLLKKQKICFMFTGQGSQRNGMGKALYEYFPIFRETVDLCDSFAQPYINISIKEIMFNSTSDLLQRPEFTQIGLFIFEYALATLWMSFGVKPNILLGHSLGEYVAVCVAGALQLEDAIKLVCTRGKLTAELPATGKMLAVRANKEKILEILHQNSIEVDFAAVNSPVHTVLSGPGEVIRQAKDILEHNHFLVRELKVAQAFHSSCMEPMLDKLHKEMEAINVGLLDMPVISNVTASEFMGTEKFDADYVCKHLRSTVQFSDSVEQAVKLGSTIFIEIGPAQVLSVLAKQSAMDQSANFLVSVSSVEDELKDLLAAVGNAYEIGLDINWNELSDHSFQKLHGIPGYHFDGKEFWLGLEKIDIRPKKDNITMLSPQKPKDSELFDSVVEIIAKLAEVDKETITLETNFKTDLNFDSLILMQLKVKLDQQIDGFKRVSIRDLVDVNTVKDLVDIACASCSTAVGE